MASAVCVQPSALSPCPFPESRRCILASERGPGPESSFPNSAEVALGQQKMLRGGGPAWPGQPWRSPPQPGSVPPVCPGLGP